MVYKNAREPLLLKGYSLSACRMEDCKYREQYKQFKMNDNENKWIKKGIHGQFHGDAGDKRDRGKIYLRMIKSDLESETELLISDVKRQVLRTSNIKYRIDNT